MVSMIHSFTVSFNWKRILIVVKDALVNAPLHEEVYIDQPKGFFQNNWLYFVCLLPEALYGISKASREWHYYLRKFLVDTEYEQ